MCDRRIRGSWRIRSVQRTHANRRPCAAFTGRGGTCRLQNRTIKKNADGASVSRRSRRRTFWKYRCFGLLRKIRQQLPKLPILTFHVTRHPADLDDFSETWLARSPGWFGVPTAAPPGRGLGMHQRAGEKRNWPSLRQCRSEPREISTPSAWSQANAIVAT